jgi:competence protein ComFC
VVVLTGWLKQLRHEVTDFFFPCVCMGCGKVGGFVCENCSRKMSRILPPLCRRCGRPESSGAYCAECWKHKSSLDAVRSVFIFEGIVRQAVHEFKYRNVQAVSGCMAGFMSRYFLENGLIGDMLVPVPLHDRRLRQRGYNQSQLLAADLSQQVSVAVNTVLVKRVRNTGPQARSSSVYERRANMENAFECTSGAAYGRDIVVIDDVCTSGATLESCASALKKAGAKSVLGFTLAREIYHRS